MGRFGVVPDRRTIIVLGALVMGMTLTSMLLLVMEPGPVAPLSGITLESIDRSSHPTEKLFDTANARDWRAIVIHDSGSLHGSAGTLNELHQRLGRDGLGYDFVIDNGNGGDDGLIEVGFRWAHQLQGAYVQGKGADWFNNHAIGICVIGNTSHKSLTQAQLHRLVWLVQQLQDRFNIPRNAVFVDLGAHHGTQPGRFPHAWFRQQLLSVR